MKGLDPWPQRQRVGGRCWPGRATPTVPSGCVSPSASGTPRRWGIGLSLSSAGARPNLVHEPENGRVALCLPPGAKPETDRPREDVGARYERVHSR